MFDERKFIRRVETADVEDFGGLLVHPSPEEEGALRVYFGNDRYKLMHNLALRRGRFRSSGDTPCGNVVVIHSFLGSDLTARDRDGNETHVWPSIFAIAGGQLTRLQLSEDGLADATEGDHIRATSIAKRYYGELLLTLTESWNVRAFWYDWRKDFDIAADALHAQLSDWFDESAPVHLVTHGMGGLVARTFIERHRDRWEAMWDPGGGQRAPGTLGGRLVMLGAPSHGSFEVPRTLAGLGRTIRRIDELDTHHTLRDYIRVFASFVSPWQMLPSKIERPEVAPLYDDRTYPDDLGVSRYRIAVGEEHHLRLRDVVDPGRMVSINGSNRPTVEGITDFSNLSASESYTVTWSGDGWAPERMSRLASPDGVPVPAYFVDEDHGGLPSNRAVLAALDDILRTGTSHRLRATPIVPENGHQPADDIALASLRALLAMEDTQFDSLLRRSRTWRLAADAPRSTRDLGPAVVFASTDEVQIEEYVTQGVLTTGFAERLPSRIAPFSPARIEVRLVLGGIEDLDHIARSSTGGPPVDAIAVGLYLGSTPQLGALALDRAISAALPGVQRNPDGGLHDSDLLITQFTERGTLRPELGQNFFFDDPRPLKGRNRPPARLIAIVGMGMPGRFGDAELTVVARELCWALGRLGKRHLATTLIGIGRNNLSPRDATTAWLRGIKHAVTGSIEAEQRTLTRVTFVDGSASTIQIMQQTIRAEQERLAKRGRMIIDFEPLDENRLAAQEMARRASERADSDSGDTPRDPDRCVPSRISVTLKGGRAYHFGAITENAAIPEREIVVDPSLITQANDSLPAARDIASQLEEGEVLERMLLPAEFRAQIYSGAPLVLMLDPAMARIHWEMIAQSDYELLPRPVARDGRSDWHTEFDPRRFLGTCRGVTRQLRTTFATPPDPPPPPRRVMRVLVVADPAADNRLPGAEEEGAAVAELFEQFNTVHEQSDNRIEVVTLLGPQEATRKNVMKALLLHSFDVMHFAGHCDYDEVHPEVSGWIFTNNERITAAELNRIDRIPNFIFSNACESGVTPDRSEHRSAGLGPTFAEAFFQRGVTNFVCTAWPVDDIAAQEFAVSLYERLLGLVPIDRDRRRYGPAVPELMHIAMRDARLAVAETAVGVQTWGAYQHYGSPYMRFFDPSRMSISDA